MKTVTKITAAALALAFLFTGCASSAPKSTAIVPNQEVLKVSQNDENTMYYLNEKVDLGSYNNIVVKPVEIVEDEKEDRLDPKLSNEISTYFQDKLSEDLNKVVVNDKTTQKDLELLVAINDVDVSFDDLKFYQYIPVAFVVNAVKKGTGIEKKKLRISVALKLVDKQTGQTVAIVLDRKAGKELENKKVITLADLKPLLDKWSNRFSKKLNEIRNGNLEKTNS